MLIQVNGKGLNDQAGGADAIEAELARKLSRFSERLTRVELFYEDANGDKGGAADKQVRIEARPASGAPIAVRDEASDAGPAINGATSKLIAALDSQFGKQDRHR